MKKQNLKPLILSALGAMAMAGVGTGATFALFTDKAETQINVQAGVIDVGTSASIFKVFEYNGTEAGLEVAATAEDNYTNSIGGTTKKLQDGTFGLGNWAPGDRVQIKVNASNASTVKAKVRLKAVLSGVLADALVVKIGNDSFTTVELAAQGNRTLVTDWTEFAPGSNPANFGIEVSFPNVGTEITSRDEGENNLFQGKSASLLVTYEAVQANASVTSSLLERANTILATNSVKEGANATFSQALGDFTAEMKAELIASPYVYGIEEDQFYETSSVEQGNEYRYFKPMSSDDASGYSIYAKPDWATASVDLVGRGFDAGDSVGVMAVNYVGASEARHNIIRTNSFATAVTVNAAADTVHHYGDAASVNIVAVANNSYHEHGNVAFTEIAKGRIVLEPTSEVKQIHIVASNKTPTVEQEAFQPIVIKDNGVAVGKLPSKITRDQVEVPANDEKLVVTVVSAQEVEEEVYVYPHNDSVGATGTTEKITEGENQQNPNVETALGVLVLDNGNQAGEKAINDKEAAQAAAIDAVIADAGYVVRISTKYYTSFDDAFADTKNNDTLRVINDCNAWGRYDVSGKNLSIFVEPNVTLSCGTVTNGKFDLGWSNAPNTFTLEGTGKITFTTDANWGLVTQNGSGNDITVTVRDLTIEASSADGMIMTGGNLTVESGHYKNIAFLNGQIKKGYKAEYNPDTGYSDIVVAPPADAVFLATPNDTSVPSEYITPAQIEKRYLAEAPAFSGGNYTLKLLNDHTIDTINESVYSKFSGINIEGDNIVVDLNGKTLSYIGSSYNLFDGVAGLEPRNLTIKNGTLIATGNYFANIEVETLVFDNVSMALHSGNGANTFNGYCDDERYFYVDCSQSITVYAYTAFMANVYDYVVPGECEYEYSVKAVIGGQNVFCKGSKALYNFTGEILNGDFSFNNSQAGRDIYVYSAQDYRGTTVSKAYNLALKQNGTINLHLGENAGTIKVGGPTNSNYAKKISDNNSSATSFYNDKGHFYTISSAGTHTLVIS